MIKKKREIYHNNDVQSVFSWAPKVVGKCGSKHWFPVVQTDGLSGGRSVYGHVITQFCGMGRFT